MNFEPSEDLRAFQAAIDKLVERQPVGMTGRPVRFEYDERLQRDLDEAGFLDCVQVDELGRIGAAQMIMALSRLPQCVELTGSALVAQAVCPDAPRPVALCVDAQDRPLRFLPLARTLISVRGTSVAVASLAESDVSAVDSAFAYPMGVLRDPEKLAWREVGEVDAQRALRLWQMGVAAEIVGSLSAGLESVVDHVKNRTQFGRPLGSLQAIQHRLAECAVLIDSARWLTLKAADGLDPVDVSIALGQAQQIANKVPYDLHQFMGAMGLTLEHPLHRWTYRARLLRSEFGGADRQFVDAAEAAWRERPAEANESVPRQLGHREYQE